jgi:hypothetical protein
MWSRGLLPDCGDNPVHEPGLLGIEGGDLVIWTSVTSDYYGDSSATCVLRMRSTDGQPLWRQHRDATSGSLALQVIDDREGGLIVAGSVSGGARIFRLDAGQGSLDWDYRDPVAREFTMLASPQPGTILAAGIVGTFVGDVTYRVASLIDGSPVWAATTDSSVSRYEQARLLGLANGDAVLLTNYLGVEASGLVARRYTAGTGQLVMERDILGERMSDARAVAGNRVLVSTGQRLVSFDPEDFNEQWHVDVEGTFLPTTGTTTVSLVRRPESPLRVSVADVAINDGSIESVTALPGIPETSSELVDVALLGSGSFRTTALLDRSGNFAAQTLWLGDFSADGLVQWSTNELVLGDTSFHGRFDIVPRRSTTHYTTAGEPGIVLTGGAELEDDEMYTPLTPWVVKVSGRDGRTLWTWNQGFEPRHGGGFRDSAMDAEGNIVAYGVSRPVGSSSAPLLVKLDGATGNAIWMRRGADGSALSVAPDAAGDVLVTGNVDTGHSTSQYVAKYAGSDGALIWKRLLLDAGTAWDDLYVTANESGDAFVVGAARSGEYYGIQVAKLRGSDGVTQWIRPFFPSKDWIYQVNTYGLVTLPGGDLLINSDLGDSRTLTRLAAGDGHIVWQRGHIGSAGQVLDPEGHILSFGSISSVANIQRLDPESGVSEWETEIPSSNWTMVTAATFDTSGNALVAYTGNEGLIVAMVVNLDLHTGDVLWTGGVTQPDSDEYSFATGIQQAADGSVFVSANYDDLPGAATWTVFKLTGPFADDIYANGFEP